MIDFSKAKVAVFGDAMLDVFVNGTTSRNTPEDESVPVLDVQKREMFLGGAAGVAAHVRGLGADALFCGRVGADAGAADFCKLMAGQKLPQQHLIVEPTLPTTVKTRFVCDEVYRLRVDEEVNAPLPQDILNKALESLRPTSDVLVVSDYGKGMVNDGAMKSVLTHWSGKGRVLVDPKKGHAVDFIGAYGLKPNLSEAAWLLGLQILPNTDEAAKDAAQQLLQKFKAQVVLLTRSEAGATLATADGMVKHIANAGGKVVNVSGAGDAVMAGFAAALAAGQSAVQAAEFAVRCGSAFVSETRCGALDVTKLTA